MKPTIEITWRDENYGSQPHLHAFRVYQGLTTQSAKKAFSALAKRAGFDSDARRACWGSGYNENAAATLIAALKADGYTVIQKGCKTVE